MVIILVTIVYTCSRYCVDATVDVILSRDWIDSIKIILTVTVARLNFLFLSLSCYCKVTLDFAPDFIEVALS